jgi:hypothetical protein
MWVPSKNGVLDGQFGWGVSMALRTYLLVLYIISEVLKMEENLEKRSRGLDKRLFKFYIADMNKRLINFHPWRS